VGHAAPAAASVLALIEEQPAAVAALLEADEALGAQEVDGGERDDAQRAVEVVVVDDPIEPRAATDEAGVRERVAVRGLERGEVGLRRLVPGGQRRHRGVDALAQRDRAGERPRGGARVRGRARREPGRRAGVERPGVPRPPREVGVAVEPLVVPRARAQTAERVGEVEGEGPAEAVERRDVAPE
jgi:hypothetical protein